MIKKIAILTSGGDAPGMNNVVYSVVQNAKVLGIKPYLIFDGYKGLFNNKIVNAKDVDLKSFISSGGTHLRSARFLEFKEEKYRKKSIEILNKKGIDALVVIGGDGSYMGAQKLHELGLKTIAIPGTIDNDIASSDFTIGFDTALNTIVDSIDKIRDTMDSMKRICLIEVMGHGAGDLSYHAGIATGAEEIITNNAPKTKEQLLEIIKKIVDDPRMSSGIIVISEFVYKDLYKLAEELEAGIDHIISVRAVTLGYIQRGGTPSAMERFRAMEFGRKAVELLSEGKSGLALGYKENHIKSFNILDALKETNESSIKREKELVNKYNLINKA